LSSLWTEFAVTRDVDQLKPVRSSPTISPREVSQSKTLWVPKHNPLICVLFRKVHHNLIGAGNIQPLALPWVVANVVLQPLAGDDKNERDVTSVRQGMCRTSACKPHKVSWSDFMGLVVNRRLTIAGKDVNTFFFVEVPMIFGGLASWLERYEVKAKLAESGHFAK